jgi:hypothetical protein
MSSGRGATLPFFVFLPFFAKICFFTAPQGRVRNAHTRSPDESEDEDMRMVTLTGDGAGAATDEWLMIMILTSLGYRYIVSMDYLDQACLTDEWLMIKLMMLCRLNN